MRLISYFSFFDFVPWQLLSACNIQFKSLNGESLLLNFTFKLYYLFLFQLNEDSFLLINI